MADRPNRKPDIAELLTPDQLGQALAEYVAKHRGQRAVGPVALQYNTFEADGTVRVEIFNEQANQ